MPKQIRIMKNALSDKKTQQNIRIPAVTNTEKIAIKILFFFERIELN